MTAPIHFHSSNLHTLLIPPSQTTQQLSAIAKEIHRKTDQSPIFKWDKTPLAIAAGILVPIGWFAGFIVGKVFNAPGPLTNSFTCGLLGAGAGLAPFLILGIVFITIACIAKSPLAITTLCVQISEKIDHTIHNIQHADAEIQIKEKSDDLPQTQKETAIDTWIETFKKNHEVLYKQYIENLDENFKKAILSGKSCLVELSDNQTVTLVRLVGNKVDSYQFNLNTSPTKHLFQRKAGGICLGEVVDIPDASLRLQMQKAFEKGKNAFGIEVAVSSTLHTYRYKALERYADGSSGIVEHQVELNRQNLKESDFNTSIVDILNIKNEKDKIIYFNNNTLFIIVRKESGKLISGSMPMGKNAFTSLADGLKDNKNYAITGVGENLDLEAEKTIVLNPVPLD